MTTTKQRPWRPRSLLRTTILPAAIMLLLPPSVGLIWYTHTRLEGSVVRLAQWFATAGPGAVLEQVWGPIIFGSPAAWAMIGVFAVLELLLLRLLPGRLSEGATTPAGEVLVHKANGIAAFAVTIALFLLCSFGLKLFSPTIIYDHFGELIGALNLVGIGLCLGLYLKGRYAPSGPDHGLSGNPIFD